MDTNPSRRRVAKTCFWLSGKAQVIKTPRRTTRIVSIHDVDGNLDLKTEPAGRRWLPCRFSLWLLKQSLRWDPSHWDHWALQHTDCDPAPCPECDGCFCEDRDFLDNH